MLKLSLLTGSVVLLVALAVFSPVEAGHPPPKNRESLDLKKVLKDVSEKIAKIRKDAKEKAEKAAKEIAAKAAEEVAAAMKHLKDILAATKNFNSKLGEAFDKLIEKIKKYSEKIAKGKN